MNAYPSWIHRIPEMIEVLAMADTEHIDRRVAERLFDLRATAPKALLSRMGADLCGHSLVISRGLLMARLRRLTKTWTGGGRFSAWERCTAGSKRCGQNVNAPRWSRSRQNSQCPWWPACHRRSCWDLAPSSFVAGIWPTCSSNWFN